MSRLDHSMVSVTPQESTQPPHNVLRGVIVTKGDYFDLLWAGVDNLFLSVPAVMMGDILSDFRLLIKEYEKDVYKKLNRLDREKKREEKNKGNDDYQLMQQHELDELVEEKMQRILLSDLLKTRRRLVGDIDDGNRPDIVIPSSKLVDFNSATAAQYEIRPHKSGIKGYGMAIYRGDVRIWLSSGYRTVAYIQIGPRWIERHGVPSEAIVAAWLKDVGFTVPKDDVEFRIKRLEVCMDFRVSLPDALKLSDFEAADDKHDVWIGHGGKAKPWKHDETGQLNAFTVGNTGKAIFLRVYDKLQEIIDRHPHEMPRYDALWGGSQSAVTRVEYSIKFGSGKFQSNDLRYLSDITSTSLEALWRYLLDYGYLAMPDDRHYRHWETHPFWAAVAKSIRKVTGQGLKMKRVHTKSPSAELLTTKQQLTLAMGHLAGLLARSGALLGLDRPCDIGEFLIHSEDLYGQDLAALLTSRSEVIFAALADAIDSSEMVMGSNELMAASRAYVSGDF